MSGRNETRSQESSSQETGPRASGTLSHQRAKPRYRYSIAGLLLLLSIIAAILGIYVNRDNYRSEFMVMFRDTSIREDVLRSDAFIQKVVQRPEAGKLRLVKNGSAATLLSRNLRAVSFTDSNVYRIQLTGNSYRHYTAEFNELLECVALECAESHDAVIISLPVGGPTKVGR
ncbi:MAG: hypothetical protein ACI9G1_000484 [Pirellulaceae bacterium]|jgi:hypothetical protein